MKYSYKRIFIHNTFKHFGKKWKNGNWSVGLKIFLIAFFKNWNSFWDFKFYRKDCFFKRGLKNFEENDLYKTVDIHDDTTAIKTIASNGLVLFERLECFFKFLKRKLFMLHRRIALREIFTFIFGNYWNLAHKCSACTIEISIKFSFSVSL